MFKIIENNLALRWINYNNYFNILIKPKINKKNNLFAFLTFNSAHNSINLIDYFNKNSEYCTLLIVDNNSNNEETEKILEAIRYHENIWYIKSKYNLGSSGGNALIIEHFLEYGYDNLILTEDDTIPDIDLKLNSFIEHMNNYEIVLSKYINNNSLSFSYHFTCYSKKLLKYVGIPDPRFFQGGDDYFFDKKINIYLTTFSYEKKIINAGYFHPTNKGRNTPFKIFLSSRNMILINFKFKNYLGVLKRIYILNLYILKKLFSGEITIFLYGLFLFKTLKNINKPGFDYLKITTLKKSLDDDLNFTYNSLNSDKYPPIYDDVSRFLNIKKASLKDFNFRTSSLENLKNLLYIIFSIRIKIEKNYDYFITKADIAYHKITLFERIITFFSLFISLIISPFSYILFFVYYKLYYLINIED